MAKAPPERPQGIITNDRFVEEWDLVCPTDRGYADRKKTVSVFAHPKDGHRGSPTEYLVVSYDGVVFTDTDIIALREKVQKHHIGLNEDEFEKVIIVRTDGETCEPGSNREHSASMGIRWEIAWLAPKLGFVFDEKRRYKLNQITISKTDKSSEFANIWGKHTVIPWTAERETALENAAAQLTAIRETLAKAMADNQGFAKLLDTSWTKLLESPKP